MPQSHDKHVDKKTCAGCVEPVFETLFPDRLDHEPGKEKIPEPMGQRNMPPIPKLLNVNALKRPPEIVRGTDTEEIAGANSHEAIPGKVEKQIKSIAVCIENHVVPGTGAVNHPHAFKEYRGKNHLVNQSKQNFKYAFSGKLQVLSAGADVVQILKKPLAWLGRGGGNSREEQQKSCKIQNRHFGD